MIDDDLEAAAKKLDESTSYRVLRRVPLPQPNPRELAATEKLALIIDTETTGLDLLKDEVIEIGIVGVAYNEKGITDIITTYEGLREPSVELSEAAIRITGLTREQLKGCTLDLVTLEDLVKRADLIVAHNAALDRPMCERLCPIFKEKPWGCTATEVDWRAHGFESAKLKFLLLENGFFYDAHRAMDDCFALVHLLRQQFTQSSAFTELLETARRPTYEIFLRAHYDFRQDIRARGYRWNSQGHAKDQGWILKVGADALDREVEFLERNFSPNSIVYKVKKLNAFSRYRLS